MEYKTGDKIIAEVTIKHVDYEANTGSVIYYTDGWVPASKVITDKPAAKYVPAADQKEINITRSEYDSYIETAARIDIVKNYIENESYPSLEVIRIMLGIDKTS